MTLSPVVATGGALSWLKKTGDCVWLDADISTLISRIRTDAPTAFHRPDLTSRNLEEETRLLLDARRPLYRQVAGITINTADHSPEAAAGIIIRRLDYGRL